MLCEFVNYIFFKDRAQQVIPAKEAGGCGKKEEGDKKIKYFLFQGHI